MNFPHIPQIVPVRPVVLITGFLGAGKTTLLGELLKAARNADLSADVILNDYADASLDSARLEKIAQSVEPLTATCACCEGLDFLLELSMKSSTSQSDILFVELNGTADPVPIVESFTLLENKLQLHPRWQVCVVDVRHFGKRTGYSDIEELQLQTASHIYFSHVTQASIPDSVLNKVQAVNPYATIVNKDEFISMVVSLGEANNKIVNGSSNKNGSNDLNLVKKSHNHHKTHEFTACQILLPKTAPEKTIRNWLDDLPPDVIRAKALIELHGKPNDRYLFERVGSSATTVPQKVLIGKNVPNSAILIGPDLDLEKLQQQAMEHLGHERPTYPQP